MPIMNTPSFPSDTIDFSNVGGYTPGSTRHELQRYAWRALGPQAQEDAVIFNAAIDASVVPAGSNLRYLPAGRIFSMLPNGCMIPGVRDEYNSLSAGILIGSDSDGADVIGIVGGDPADDPDSHVAIKGNKMAPFQSLIAGYCYETSEYDIADSVQLVPGTLLTTTVSDVTGLPQSAAITNFDLAGIVKPGNPYTDHIIGIVVRGPEASPTNAFNKTIVFQGLVIPRIKNGLAYRA